MACLRAGCRGEAWLRELSADEDLVALRPLG